jgi:hypothetical protein
MGDHVDQPLHAVLRADSADDGKENRGQDDRMPPPVPPYIVKDEGKGAVPVASDLPEGG